MSRNASLMALIAAAIAGSSVVDAKPKRQPRPQEGPTPSMRYDWWPVSTIKRSADPAKRAAKKTKNRGANASRGKTYKQIFCQEPK